MSKRIPPNFLYPTNFRNSKDIKRLIKDFNVQGYGVAIYVIETLAETSGYKYPIEDIDLLADEMRVSLPVVTTVIKNYNLFEVVEEKDGTKFICSRLNKWLEPYHKKIEDATRAGKLSALKRRKKQEEQIKTLSESDSTQQSLNASATINKRINKQNKENKEEKNSYANSIDWDELNEKLLAKQIQKDKTNDRLEDLAQQSSNKGEEIDF